FSISSRSTTRAAGLAASSEISIPAMPFCSASKFSLSCPYEPLLSNGSTAMPGRVSWPRPWAHRSRPIEPSSANETNARRRARIESVTRSESQCHAFLRRHDLGGQTLRSCLAAGSREQCVDGLVAVLGLMMEQHQALHARIARQRHRFLERRVAPSPVLFQLLGRVHRVVNEQLHTPQERHDVPWREPQMRTALPGAKNGLKWGSPWIWSQCACDSRISACTAPFWRSTSSRPSARMPVPASRMTSWPPLPPLPPPLPSTATQGVLPP